MYVEKKKELIMVVPKIGSMIWEGDYSVKTDTEFRYGKRLKYFDYNWWKPEDEKIVVFSDYTIPQGGLPRFTNVPYKVAWLMESPVVFASFGGHAAALKWLLQNLDTFVAVATCDDSLVERYPSKMKFVPFGGIIIPKELTRLYSKTKLCSMTAGRLYSPRDLIFNKYKDSGTVDFLGKIFNKPYAATVEGFRDYMYHISVSSCCTNRYFSSNLTDALACGTVPIWRGCSKIGDFFDMDGIITFDTLDDLDAIMKRIGPEDYNKRLGAIQTNLMLVEKYRTPDNVLWENVLSELYGKI